MVRTLRDLDILNHCQRQTHYLYRYKKSASGWPKSNRPYEYLSMSLSWFLRAKM